MSTEADIEGHYTRGRLIDMITDGIAVLGKTPETVTVDDLAPVDEFHTGGRRATEDLIAQLNLTPGTHAYEIGAGLGGTARFVCGRYGCRVTGIDLTAEFVDCAKTLTGWVGMEDRLDFHAGSALETRFDDASFDAAFMLHVGMNIADKAALFAETARVLKPGAGFGVYDVMSTGAGPMTYPVPWATVAANSALAGPDDYKAALEAAGFGIVAERNRRDFALDFFSRLRARAADAPAPPPLGIHIVMGADTQAKIANMIAGIEAGAIAPVEIIAERKK